MTDDPRNDAEIEAALRRYRPAGPPPGLRSRVLDVETGAPSGRHSIPWLVWGAIAALVTLACAAHVMTARIDRQVSAALDGTTAQRQILVESLTELLGGDELARLHATAIVAQVASDTAGAPATAPGQPGMNGEERR